MSDRPNPRRPGERGRQARRYPPRTSAIATGRVTPERSCTGKKRIRTPEYAEKMARWATKQYGRPQSYYFCVFCECYHLFTEGE